MGFPNHFPRKRFRFQSIFLAHKDFRRFLKQFRSPWVRTFQWFLMGNAFLVTKITYCHYFRVKYVVCTKYVFRQFEPFFHFERILFCPILKSFVIFGDPCAPSPTWTLCLNYVSYGTGPSNPNDAAMTSILF